MGTFPDGTEVDAQIPYSGRWFDAGGAIYNVMHPDFGAVGNGTTDDTAAIILAIAAAALDGGGIVFFPPTAAGYRVDTGEILLPVAQLTNIRLLGNYTKIVSNSAGNIFKITEPSGSNATAARHIIDGFLFDRVSGFEGSGVAVSISDSSHNVVQNCRFKEYSKAVSLLNADAFTEETLLSNLEIHNCDFGIWISKGSATSTSLASTRFNHISITMGSAQATTPYGIYIDTNASIYRSSFTGVEIFVDQNNAVGFYSDGSTSNIFGAINIENSTVSSPTGNIGFQFAANAAGLNMDIFSDIRGNIATELSLSGSLTPQGLIFGNIGLYPAEVRNAGSTSYLRNVMDEDLSTVRFIEELDTSDLFQWRFNSYTAIPKIVDHSSGDEMPMHHVLVGAPTVTVTDDAVAPVARARNYIIFDYTTGVTITSLTGGVNGQIVYLRFVDANVTINHDGTNFHLKGAVDWNPQADDMILLISSGGTWYELSRSINNATQTLANDATPSVTGGGENWKTGGTTTITDFDDGQVGQTLFILAEHSVTITDGSPIVLNASGNYAMTTSDTLVLKMFNDQVWHEISRSVN